MVAPRQLLIGQKWRAAAPVCVRRIQAWGAPCALVRAAAWGVRRVANLARRRQ